MQQKDPLEFQGIFVVSEPCTWRLIFFHKFHQGIENANFSVSGVAFFDQNTVKGFGLFALFRVGLDLSGHYLINWLVEVVIVWGLHW